MLAENRHQRDQDFGMIVLMVCALASRYSHDPRVFSPGDSGDDGKGPKGLSSGWKYFKQVPMHRKSLLYRAGLFDLQYYVVSVEFLSTSVSGVWSSSNYCTFMFLNPACDDVSRRDFHTAELVEYCRYPRAVPARNGWPSAQAAFAETHRRG